MSKIEWISKYRDIVEDFYWVPIYLGLKSTKVTKRDGLISIPAEQVTTSRVYTRVGNWEDTLRDLERKEEILNHIFDLTFAVAGASVVRELLIKPLGFEDRGPFESFGREVRHLYQWGDDDLTQQDGLLVSHSSIVGVELKTGARSSPEQILKYALLMCCEENRSGRKSNVGLLYIVPESSRAGLWRQCGVSAGGQIDASFLDNAPRKKLDVWLNKLGWLDESAFKSVLDRLHLAVISWTELDHAMAEITNRMDTDDPGDQTLMNLLTGFHSQLAKQEGTGV